jgi:hypothetical protein
MELRSDDNDDVDDGMDAQSEEDQDGRPVQAFVVMIWNLLPSPCSKLIVYKLYHYEAALITDGMLGNPYFHTL